MAAFARHVAQMRGALPTLALILGMVVGFLYPDHKAAFCAGESIEWQLIP